ncbi:TPA: hemagglutinin repeat-containing protein [Pseudomonas aeruginosa]|uniref:hemagglutinin repeat-containing protein n=1 Tax=Pseudomonas aeruginosa TaxID=287 RepID=UPI0021F1E91C|nr:hemagglutinin repeat-containing protein [Pseudomonas aeruginosa]MCV4128642.1 hemagglutinin repeat-containing protein [Pseudomonas aeruginosa]WBJ00194.1 Hemolysin [Pseudomonas aeruginosa]HCK4343936.1 hemagglutinin repeat-containing protein [Pseudomonas aeruginosa]
MHRDNPVFHLSPQGKLRCLIAGLLLAPNLPQAFAGGLEAAGGPGGTPQLLNQGGVPIVNIVAPNAAGLSHNQFLDYNVDRQGLVLNNALQSGTSQLAGQLAANPQLRGDAASAILNEVISRNASAINGPQEIFGQAADYILANPNGISVNGGSFINTPHASLLVGRPELADGKLQALNTGDAVGALQIHDQGLSNRGGSIALLAPRVDSQGKIEASTELDLTVGRNRIDYPSGKIERAPSGDLRPGERRIDASLFGAMQAGRINILSTAEGAGVRIGPVGIDGKDGVDLRSAGDLSISGQALPDNSLNALRAAIRSDSGNVGLHARGDLNLAAADVSGGRVDLKSGRNLTLDSVESRNLRESRERWSNSTIGITWETYDRTRTVTDSKQHGSRIDARADASLAARGDSELRAATVKTGATLKVSSGGDTRLLAATETRTERDQGAHRKHLWKANWDKGSSEQRSVASSLEGARVELGGGRRLNLEGAEVASRGDLDLQAKSVDIGSASRSHNSRDNSYSGDLVGGSFFGRHGDGDSGQTLQQGSRVKADGALTVTADAVEVRGSQVRGARKAEVVSGKGSLRIDGEEETAHSNSYSKDSKFFGIAKEESRQRSKDSSNRASEVRSDSNLTLRSAAGIAIRGSRVEAGGALAAEAKGNLEIASAQERYDGSDSRHTRGFGAYAGEQTPGSRQYRAGVRYQDQRTSVRREETHNSGASLGGASLAVKAGGDLTVKGAELKASAGDASLSGKNVALLAEQDGKTRSREQTTTGGGFYYTGGLDRAGSGIEVGHQRIDENAAESHARTSQVNATGNLRIDAARGSLTTQGARLEAGDSLAVAAGAVDNQAARDSRSSRRHDNSWSGDVGANLEYRGIARPIEKAVEGVAQRKVHQPGLLDNLEQPNVGVDLEISHRDSRGEQQASQAQVSSFAGGQVDLKVGDALRDEGTRYQARSGGLLIDAARHDARASENTSGSHEQSLDAKAGGRLYTTTGQDLNLRLSGNGGSSENSASQTTAVVGEYAAKQGVEIRLGGDGLYRGGRFDGGKGGVRLSAGGNLALEQANDRQGASSASLRGDAALSVGMAPSAHGKGLNASAGLQLDHKARDSRDSQARVADIRAKGTVELRSGGDLVLQGSNIGSAAAKSGDIVLAAGGKLDLRAARDSHQARGDNLGGGFTLGGSSVRSAETSSRNGSVSGNFNIGRVDEQRHALNGGNLHSATKASLSSAADDATAVRLQGTRIEAARVSLEAGNGGILQESAESGERRDNWGVLLGAGVNGGKTTGAPSDYRTNHAVQARAKVDVDVLRSQTQGDSVIQADQVTLASQGDTRLEGARIDAARVDGRIGGDLRVESRQDRAEGVKVNVDARLGVEKNQPGLVNKLASKTGPLKDKLETKAEKAFDKHRGKLENGIDRNVERLGKAGDNLLAKAETAKERLGEKRVRSGSYEVNPEPRGAFASKLDRARGYLAEKGEALGDRLSGLKQRLSPNKTGSYAVNDRQTTGAKVGNAAESVLFGDKSGEASVTPTLYLDVSHVSRNYVTEASGITGRQGVTLQVGTATRLTGARISASDGKVALGGSRVETHVLAGKDYRADLGLNLSRSPVDLALGIKDEFSQEHDQATRDDQAFNLGALRVGGRNRDQQLQAGIEQKAD